MEMLLLRPRSGEGRKRAGRVPVYRVRGRKFGPVVHEQALRRTKDIAIYGPHSAGKSRWLAKLHDGAAEVWLDRPALRLGGFDPIGQWLEQPAVEAWHDAQAEAQTNPQPWAKLKQPARIERLVEWAATHKAVILIDDAHKITGRKASVALRLVEVAGIVVHAASEETRVAISLRMALARRDPQVIRLSSDAAYDYTNALTWLLCIVAAAMGAWPVAAAIGGLKMLARGSRAAKQA